MGEFRSCIARIDHQRRLVETVEEHLHAVAALAAKFGDAFDAQRWTYLAGLWHDLGKIHDDFQTLIGTLDTPGDNSKRVEHSGLGAALAMRRGKHLAPIAFAIAGHHAGLPNDANSGRGDRGRTELAARLLKNEPRLDKLLPCIPTEFSSPELPAFPARRVHPERNSKDDRKRRTEFFTRFVFSALVDADRLTAEGFGSEERSALRTEHDSLHVLRDSLEQRLCDLTGTAAQTPVNAIRAQIADACKEAAQLPPGVFTLDVPTGGGKTLASMRFALHHAIANNLRRVIVVIPYTSIITQNAQEYREIFRECNVLEHHAAVNIKDRAERDEKRHLSHIELATENWDKPVVVTTTVRFFESLFGASTSACRRLHNIARSVVVLDEVQTLPPSLLAPILDGLTELVTNYGVTVVLSTATQPALAERPETDDRHAFPGLPRPAPIIPDTIDMAPLKGRVSFRWPARALSEESNGFEKWTNDRVAQELANHPQALCIVNTKKDAREIAALLAARFGERVVHLTTALCPAHRADVLAEVYRRLLRHEPCLLVATQLVEAGVNLDFPIVYRAMAGLDSIVQAAGRCNREGKLTADQRASGLGTTVVYQPIGKHSDKTYERATNMTCALLQKHGGALNLDDPAIVTEYFEDFYAVETLDAPGIQSLRANYAFETVEQKFKIIDSNTVSVVVPYPARPPHGKAGAACASSKSLAAYRAHPTRDTRRALQPYSVAVYPNALTELQKAGAVEAVGEGIDDLYALSFLQGKLSHNGLYDHRLGLNMSVLDGGRDHDTLIL